MKKIILPLLWILLLVSGFKVATKEAKDEQQKIAMFISEMHEATLTDTKAAVAVADKTTNEPLKEYALMVIKEEASFQTQLEALAKTKGVSVSMTLSEKRVKALEKLKAAEGKKLEKGYKKLVKANHKRSIRMYKKAMNFKDADVSNFAKQTLPIIEGHFYKIKAIK